MTLCELEMHHVNFYLCGLKINLLGDDVNTIKSNSSIFVHRLKDMVESK